MSSTYLEAKRIINGKSFNEVANLPSVDERFSYGSLNGREGEGLVDLNFKDILVTVRNENGVANIVNYEQYDENNQFDNLIYTNESKQKKVVKLSESKLRKIVSESIKKMLSERYEPGDTLSIPPHKPIIKGKTPNGYDDEYAGMDNNVGVIMMNDISKILDEARYWYGVTTDSSVAEELGVVIDCLNRAFEATMNLSKMQID